MSDFPQAPSSSAAAAAAAEFVSLWQSGDCSASAHSRLASLLSQTPLSGRLFHGMPSDEDFVKGEGLLASQRWKRIAWCFGADALPLMLGKDTRGIALMLGMGEKWLNDQIRLGKRFKLAIFPSEAVDATLADWTGVEQLVQKFYPEVWPKVAVHLPQIKAMSFADIDALAGYGIEEANQKGRTGDSNGAFNTDGESKDPNYISEPRLRNREGTLVQVRQFLYDELGLRKLYRGDGRTVDENGEYGSNEYLAENKALPDIEGCVVVDAPFFDVPFAQVNVFSGSASSLFDGNPVAVVNLLNAVHPSSAQLQAFANWTNLSETTFILPPVHPSADYLLRIFTTTRELPFAGHPTLGSCHVWLSQGLPPKSPLGVVVQECGAGLVNVHSRNGGTLAFEAPEPHRTGPIDAEELATLREGLGLDAVAVVAHSHVALGPPWRGLLVADEATVLGLKPDLSKLKGIDVGVIGPVDKDAGKDYDFEVRAFAPLDGMEDPVTGSLNAGLAKWMFDSGRVKGDRYVVRQGTQVGRNGRVFVEREGDGKIFVGGRCKTIIEGKVKMPS